MKHEPFNPFRIPHSAFRISSPLALCLLATATAQAQDRIVLRRGATGRVVVNGTINDYTGREITFRGTQGDGLSRYDASEVIEVQTPQIEPHTRALKLLAGQQVAPAITQLELALKQESRLWVRREILALLVKGALRLGDFSSAGSRFQALVESDPATRHFGLIPLVWGPQEVSAAVRADAQDWLARAAGVPRLIGASLLLFDARFSEPARAALRELSSSTDPRIKVLAQAQGWRIQSPGDTPSTLQLERWQERVDEMPEGLRAGPYYLLGRAYSARRDYELAAAAFLWLPLMDDHDHVLTARACLEAGLALGEIGKRTEAATLFREVTRRFADTPFAREAEGLLHGEARRQ